MKVKVGDKIYDPENEPVMVILTEEDKENISNMSSDNSKYCAFPEEGWSEEAISIWMKDGVSRIEKQQVKFLVVTCRNFLMRLNLPNQSL